MIHKIPNPERDQFAPVEAEARPSTILSVIIFVVAVASMAYLRLVVFRHQFIALTYGLPLLLCLWHRDRRLLWSMAAAFICMAALKAFWWMPDANPGVFEEAKQFLMQVINIVAVASAIHVILALLQRLRKQNRRLAEANEELAASEEEVRQQNEQLQHQGEELNQQNEELQQQAGELNQQNAELQQSTEAVSQQAEELQEVNKELNARESLLRGIISVLGEAGDETQLLRKVCEALMVMSGQSVMGAAVVERVGDRLVVRMHVGAETLRHSEWEYKNSFASVVIEENRTAFVDDLERRPDLIVPQPEGRKVRSLLATPLKLKGKCVGVVEVYRDQPREWTRDEFRFIEWAQAQCAMALEAVRLRAELRRSNELTEAVNRISQDLHSTLNPEDVMRLIVTQGAAALGSETAAISERKDGGWLVRYVHGMPAEIVGLRLDDHHERHSLLAIQTRDVLCIEDCFNDERCNREHLRHYNVRSVLLAPVIVRGEIFGVIFFNYHSGKHAFTEAELGFARQLAFCAASALSNAQLFEQQKQAELILRETEERFRVLADGTPVIIWVHDEHGGLRFVNLGYREFFGISIEQVTGGTWHPLVHPEDARDYVGLFDQAHAEQRRYHAQARVRRVDGQWRWIESFGQPRFSSAGEFLGMAGSSMDITERKEAEAVLARGKEDLEQLVAARTVRLQELVGELEHFSYTLVHDMRAPLRAMRGIAEIIQEGNGDSSPEERGKFLRRIITAAERMDGLITDALSYNRAVRLELPLAPVDPGKLLREMLDTYPELQTAADQISIAESFPLVMGNEAGLTQCFSNLLGNALKFAKPGEQARVRVWTEMVAHESPGDGSSLGWVRLWVEDNGIGISESMKPRVFHMFARGASPQAGTGIGLALVRKVVDRMGGRVGVESEADQGSRFWLELKTGDCGAVAPVGHRAAVPFTSNIQHE